MTLLVSHISALRFWRLTGSTHLGVARGRRRATERARTAFEKAERPMPPGECEMRSLYACVPPVHVLVPCAGQRTQAGLAKSHVWGSAIPPRSFVDIGDGLFVSTPEFAFLQMASLMTLPQLIQLGYELCGTYALGDGGSHCRDAPLTTRCRLSEYLQAARGSYGVQKARRALTYVAEGSDSPMETMLAMHLSLPYAQGGFGIEMPLLNHRIDIPQHIRKVASQNYCKCDLCWPAANLDVEYDSDLHHTGAEKIAADSMRRNTLMAMGMKVITVTSAQMRSRGSLFKVAGIVAKHTGKRLRYKEPEFTRAFLKLRNELCEGGRLL